MNGPLKPYPSILQSWGILGIALLGMFIFIPVNQVIEEQFGKKVALFIYYALSMVTPLIIAHFLRKKATGIRSYSLGIGSPLIYLILVFSTLGFQTGLSMPLASLLPMPDIIREMFKELGQMSGIFGFLTIVVAAPILEEWIFRGIILEGLLKRYSVLKSILFSSFLFGIVHLNPWQFISAMILGSFSGWVYYKTRNLTYSIFIHFINNLVPFIWMQFYSADALIDISMTEMFGGEMNAGIAITFSILMAGIGIYLLQKKVKEPHLIADAINSESAE